MNRGSSGAQSRFSRHKKRVEQIYFLDSGVASVVANGEREIEVGMIGREGVVGLPVVLGNGDRFPNEIYMQIAGSGRRLSARCLPPGDRRQRYPAPSTDALRAFVHDPDHPDGSGQWAQQDRRAVGPLATDGA